MEKGNFLFVYGPGDVCVEIAGSGARSFYLGLSDARGETNI